MNSKALMLVTIAGITGIASADIRITEYMYQGIGGSGEFFELTNTGNSAIDLSGWRMLDDQAFDFGGAEPDDFFDLSFFGLVGAGESIVITEDDAAAFSANWNLDASVRVLGGLGDLTGRNLGRNDSIFIYDAMDNIIDVLSYGDQDFPGTPRMRFASGNPLAGAVGTNDPFGWAQSFVGDEFGSFEANSGDIGNPGTFIPAPGALALLGLGGLMGARRRR